MATNKVTRILIVEDHPIFRIGMSELINQEGDLKVCGEAEDIGKAWEKIKKLDPDLVIIDISLKGRNGLELIHQINSYKKNMPVLVLSMHDETLYAQRALRAGAKGYIMKKDASESVIKAIRSVLEGKIYVSEKIIGNILETLSGQAQTQDRSVAEKLTDRELEVFQLIGQGSSTKEIAEQLSLSVKTIGTYRERIKEKLNLKNTNELIRHAVHWVDNEELETDPEE